MSFLIQKLKWCFTCRDSVRVPMNAEERGAVPGNVPYWGANSIQDYVRDSLFNEELVLLGEDGAPFFDPLRDVAFRVNGPIWPNNHVHVLQPKEHVDARYMAYALNSHVDYSLYVGGATRDKLTQGAMDTIELPCPEKRTQTAIANYLDRKTAAIDALIEKKERLIEEVRKYQKALITESTLRGVDAQARLAPSRVKEMGMIPEHWKVAKTARVLKYIKGAAVSKDLLDTEGEESRRFLRTGDLWNVNGHEKSRAYVIETEGLVWKREGEMVVCFDGFNSVVGKGTVGMARFDGEGFIDSHLELIEVSGSQYLKRFYEYVHFSSYVEHEVVKRARGAIAFSAGYSKYDISVPVPPIEEQVEIVAVLDKRLCFVAPLIENSKRQIEELKSLRAALISEAVTGKLPLPADIQ